MIWSTILKKDTTHSSKMTPNGKAPAINTCEVTQMPKREQTTSNLHQPIMFGGARNPVYCRTCKFAHGKNVFEDAPEKSNCLKYPYKDGNSEMKPDSVYFDGKPCKHYEKE